MSNVSVPSAAEESDKDEDLSNDDEDEEDHLGDDRDERYYRYGIEIIDTYKSIDTFDTRKKYR